MKESKAVKVGIFLVVGLLLFAGGLFLIGNHNQVFGSHFTVYTDFANVDTLVSGAKVRVSGMAAGQVSSISVPRQPGAKFRLKLDVDKRNSRTSSARIQSPALKPKEWSATSLSTSRSAKASLRNAAVVRCPARSLSNSAT